MHEKLDTVSLSVSENSEKLQENVSKTRKTIQIVLAGSALLLATAFLVGCLYGIITYYTSGMDHQVTPDPDMEYGRSATGRNIMEYFEVAGADGLNIEFAVDINTEQKLKSAIEGSANVIGADIVGDVDSTFKTAFAATIDGYRLEDWLEVATSSNKAIKLHMKDDSAVTAALNTLREMESSLHQPVWVGCDAVARGADRPPVDGASLMDSVDRIYPNLTLVLGWHSPSQSGGGEAITWSDVDAMYELVADSQQLIVFSLQLKTNSWPEVLWLLEQSDRFSLLIRATEDDVIDVEDLIYIRDNAQLDKVFYEDREGMVVPMKQAIADDEYARKFYTGGNVLEFFRIAQRGAINVTWAHAVNTVDELEACLADDTTLMLEADIRLYGEGTSSLNTSLPVMSHDPPAFNYELTLEQWLQRVITSGRVKGIKLDFKSIGGLEAALPILRKMREQLPIPVWINSDVQQGPNSPPLLNPPRNATAFFGLIQDGFPDVTLSPGWTTAYNWVGANGNYTHEMMEEMYAFTAPLRQAVTFPVRASLALHSLTEFRWLLDKSNRYSLTVWHSGQEPVPTPQLLQLYNSFPNDKVFFDLPAEMIQRLFDAIREQDKSRRRNR